MRFIIYNPHLSQFVQSIGGRLERLPPYNKYQYFLTRLLRDHPDQIAFFVDGSSSIPGLKKIKAPSISLKITQRELAAWRKWHQIPEQIQVYSRLEDLNQEQDILFDFPFKRSTLLEGSWERHPLWQYEGRKLLHFTHYFKWPSRFAERIFQKGKSIAVAEVDISKSSFYQKYFGNLPVYILPFVLKERFENRIPFRERQPACLALGSLIYLDASPGGWGEEVRDYYREDFLHPTRKALFDANAAQLLPAGIKSRISPYSGAAAKPKRGVQRVKHLYQRFLKKKHKVYYSFDIVEEYNKHQMFVAPEESVGLPSVNFVEGMASGCAYFGVESEFYKSLGLQAGVHYVGYSGEVKDLIEKFKHYSSRPEILEPIAANGHKFVREHFSETTVARRFWDDLENWKEGIPSSSFQLQLSEASKLSPL